MVRLKTQQKAEDGIYEQKIALGWSVKNSAIAVGISNSYGWEILKNYNTLGIEGDKNPKKESGEHPRGIQPLKNNPQMVESGQDRKQLDGLRKKRELKKFGITEDGST